MCFGGCGVTATGITDKPVRSTIGYLEGRLEAVADLVDYLDCGYRVAADGSLELVRLVKQTPVWTIKGGPTGVLVTSLRSLSDSGLYNAAVSRSQTDDVTQIVGRAYLTSGPLKYGGPFGKVPIFHQAAAKTQAGVTQDAQTLFANRASQGQATSTVECLTNPALQLHDWVTVVAPMLDGDAPIVGRVVEMGLQAVVSDAGVTPAKSMQIKVQIAAADLEALRAPKVGGVGG